MASDQDTTWGTVFLDANRESTVGKLDAMQAAVRQEQWNQRTQQDYLEKVRAKATERARVILGEAYTERQKILQEAEEEALRIRNEAKAIQSAAEEVHNQNVELRHATQAELDHVNLLRSTAHEDGFQQGLAAAQEELEAFRAGMGTSVGAVLRAIEDQCLSIFANWRIELTDLLKVCVEKGTGLVLNERHAHVLEQMVISAVRQLDNRKNIVIRVNPDDEPMLMDLFEAAKERVPDLSHWIASPDASIEPGGLIAESSSGTVDSRLELFREMVGNILALLTLPESDQEAQSAAFVQKIVAIQGETVAALTPSMPESHVIPSQEPHEMAEHESTVPDTHEQASTDPLADVDMSADMPMDDILNMSAVATGHQDPPIPHSAAMAYGIGPQPDIHLPPDASQELVEQLKPEHVSEPTRQELEEELLPVPGPHDDILAAGGFLEPDATQYAEPSGIEE